MQIPEFVIRTIVLPPAMLVIASAAERIDHSRPG
jgi:hypothetical protein